MPRPDASAKLKTTQRREGPSKVLLGGIVAAIAIIALVVAVVVQEGKSAENAATPPQAAADGSGITMYPGKAKPNVPVVQIFEDPQCPFCSMLEKAIGPMLKKHAENGDIVLQLHTLNFLDQPQTQFSTYAANALYCSAEQDVFPAFHELLFDTQPQEGRGWNIADIMLMSTEAGIVDEPAVTNFRTCVEGGKWNDYVAKAQTWAEKFSAKGADNYNFGLNSPSLVINGEFKSNLYLGKSETEWASSVDAYLQSLGVPAAALEPVTPEPTAAPTATPTTSAPATSAPATAPATSPAPTTAG